MKHILKIIFLLIFFSISYSQEKTNIAVLELVGTGTSNLNLEGLTNRLRSELFKTNKFNVIERSRMEEILREQGFQQLGCTNTECAVEIGKLLSVNFIVLGNVDKVGSIYSVNVRLVNVETGKIVKNEIEDCNNCSIDDIFLTTIKKAATKLAGLSEDNRIKEIESKIQLFNEKNRDYYNKLKNPTHGAVLSILPGGGHFYVRKPKWALFYISIRIFGSLVPFTLLDEYAKKKKEQQGGAYVIGGILGIVDIVHAYVSVQDYNDKIKTKYNISLYPRINKDFICIKFNYHF